MPCAKTLVTAATDYDLSFSQKFNAFNRTLQLQYCIFVSSFSHKFSAFNRIF